MDRRGSDPFIEAAQVLQNDRHPLEILRKLNALRMDAIFTDTVLCVGHDEIPCHRNILAVSSPYFKAMFSSDLRESREGRISFNDLSSKTLRQLVDYVYTGRVEVTVDNAQDMLAAASLFHYPEVVDFCCDFLGKHLHPSNCLGIEEFSHFHSCDSLEAEAHRYTLENFTAVCESEEFLELSASRLMSYVTSDLIEVRTESVVYEAVMKWINHDPERRKSSICTLMKSIRSFALDVDYLKEVVKQNFHVAACPLCAELVNGALQFHTQHANNLNNCQHTSVSEEHVPRPSTIAKDVLIVVGPKKVDNKLVAVIEAYDPRKDRWNTLSELPVGVMECSVSAVNNDIFITGGIRDGRAVAKVWKFVSAKRSWFEMPSMLGPRARHASVAWNSKLYVIGGVRDPSAPPSAVEAHLLAIDTIECLDLSLTGNPEWCSVGLLPCPRIGSYVIPFKDQWVEIGGTQSGAVVRTMESHHCSETGVRYSAEQFVLPELIEHAKMAAIDGMFYIMWEDSKKVISLNSDRRTFRRLKDMNFSHVNGGVAVLDKYIYIMGGATDVGPSRHVERYNPTTNEWETVKSSNQELLETHSVAIKMC